LTEKHGREFFSRLKLTRSYSTKKRRRKNKKSMMTMVFNRQKRQTPSTQIQIHLPYRKEVGQKIKAWDN